MSLLFGMAGAHKLKALADFRSAIDDYQLVPENLSAFLSVGLVAAELLAALLVLIPSTRNSGFAAMAGLLLLYTAAIGINLYRGRRDLDCGCGGAASRHLISGWLVTRNLLLLIFVLLAGIPSAGRPLNWLDVLVIAFAVLVASGLYLGINQLLSQAPRLARLRHRA